MTALSDRLRAALIYARGIVVKWCYYQGNNAQFIVDTCKPIDDVLAELRFPAAALSPEGADDPPRREWRWEILMDSPTRWVLVDNESDEPAPVYETREAAEAALADNLERHLPAHDLAQWQMVPKEPTEEMFAAMMKANINPPHNPDGSISVQVQNAYIWDAALASAPPPPTDGWRDIAEAPKDGTAILAWDFDVKACVVVKWSSQCDPEYGDDGKSDWRLEWNGDRQQDLSHFRPLPEPPKP